MRITKIKTFKVFRKNIIKKTITLLSSIFVAAGQLIKQSFFSKKSKQSLAMLLVLVYVVYSDVNEHFVLSIAMFICLYYSYDAITSLIKAEVKNRNDQIYKDLATGVEKQLAGIMNKKSYLIELTNLLNDINKINSTYSHRVPHVGTNFVRIGFEPKAAVQKNVNLALMEELSFINLVYTFKNISSLDKAKNVSSEGESEFVELKLSDLDL